MPKRDLIDASSNIISTLKLIFFLYILKIPNCKLNLKNANKEIKTIVLNFSNSFFFPKLKIIVLSKYSVKYN